MKTTVSADASATLAAVDTALRRAGDLHWADSEFQRWEAGQVGELATDDAELDQPDQITIYIANVGPEHPRHTGTDYGTHVRPMVAVYGDHGCACELPGVTWSSMSGRVAEWEYPDPEDTVYGPLLLGPEPETVLAETRGYVAPESVVVHVVRMCDPVEVVAW